MGYKLPSSRQLAQGSTGILRVHKKDSSRINITPRLPQGGTVRLRQGCLKGVVFCYPPRQNESIPRDVVTQLPRGSRWPDRLGFGSGPKTGLCRGLGCLVCFLARLLDRWADATVRHEVERWPGGPAVVFPDADPKAANDRHGVAFAQAERSFAIRGSKPEPPKIPSADQRGLSRARSMG